MSQIDSQIRSIELSVKNSDKISNGESVNILEDDPNRGEIDIWKTSVLKYHDIVKGHTEKRKREVSLINSKKAA